MSKEKRPTRGTLVLSSNEIALADFYQKTLFDDVIPFWLRHGMDAVHGGVMTALDRDGAVLDTDKSIWAQGRTCWMFSVLYRDFGPNTIWLDAARSCLRFLRDHGEAPDGKLYFTVTREGAPLRLRRYAFSEAFAAIAHAAFHEITSEMESKREALRYFEMYREHCFGSGGAPAKTNPDTRPMKSLGPLMIGIVTAQELRCSLGDFLASEKTLSQWIEEWIEEIRRDFFKEDLGVLLETVSPDGAIIDHFDGRTLLPGHALEAAWFILREGHYRSNQAMMTLGLDILQCMERRGWDKKFGGLFYFRDLKGRPVPEYWQDMKFWWPHNEAIIATLLAWKITGESRWRTMHRRIHDWSFQHFSDPVYGEWYGYLHRDGTPSVHLKGTMWKGPFHLPRMLWYCHRILRNDF